MVTLFVRVPLEQFDKYDINRNVLKKKLRRKLLREI